MFISYIRTFSNKTSSSLKYNICSNNYLNLNFVMISKFVCNFQGGGAKCIDICKSKPLIRDPITGTFSVYKIRVYHCRRLTLHFFPPIFPNQPTYNSSPTTARKCLETSREILKLMPIIRNSTKGTRLNYFRKVICYVTRKITIIYRILPRLCS